MKNMKRMIALLLTALLLISLLPTVSAEEEKLREGIFYYKVENGEAIILDHTEDFSDDLVVIPETLGGYPVREIAYRAFDDASCYMKTVVIPPFVRTVQDYAFQNFGTVYLLGHDTNVEKYAFSDYKNIYLYEDLPFEKTLNMTVQYEKQYYLDDYPCDPRTLSPVTEGDFTYAVYDGEAILLQAAGSGSVTVPDQLGGAPVTRVGPECFQTKDAVYTLPDSVISIGARAFFPAESAGLTKLPANLKRISLYGLVYANLQDPTMPDSLENICKYACRYLTCDHLVIPGSVKTVKIGAFQDSVIPEIVIEEGVEALDMHCFSNLKDATVTIPRSVTACADNIFNTYYANTLMICGYMDTAAYQYAERFNIPFTDLETGTVYGSAYTTIQDGVKYFVRPGRSVDVVGLTEECPVDLVIPETVDDTPVKTINDWAISSAAVQTVSMPDTVTELNWHAFEGCTSLQYVRMSEGLERMGNICFYNCPNLKVLYLPASLTEIKGTSIIDGNRDNNPVLLGVAAGSYAETFTQANGLTAASLSEEGQYLMTDNGFYELRDGETALVGLCAESDSEDSYYLVPDSVGEYPVTAIASNAAFAGRSTVLVLGANVAVVEPGALLDSGLDTIYTTRALTSLPTPLFDQPGKIYGYTGSYAEEYADGTQDQFIALDDVPFLDVQKTDWFYDAVFFCYWNGLMNGVSDEAFDPAGTTSRAMLVTILYRLAGSDGRFGGESEYFIDVPDYQWYTPAVNWAAACGVVEGTGDYQFSPNMPVTREQVATILYRFASLAGFDVSGAQALDGFPDAGKVSSWAQTAMMWVVDAGIIEGSDVGLNPGGNASRAEIAAMIMRFLLWLDDNAQQLD